MTSDKTSQFDIFNVRLDSTSLTASFRKKKKELLPECVIYFFYKGLKERRTERVPGFHYDMSTGFECNANEKHNHISKIALRSPYSKTRWRTCAYVYCYSGAFSHDISIRTSATKYIFVLLHLVLVLGTACLCLNLSHGPSSSLPFTLYNYVCVCAYIVEKTRLIISF